MSYYIVVRNIYLLHKDFVCLLETLEIVWVFWNCLLPELKSIIRNDDLGQSDIEIIFWIGFLQKWTSSKNLSESR